jgi:glycerophosphoryl diester phosphodiesterase
MDADPSLTSSSRPLFYGHRGASGVFPENTLPAFDAAVTAGARALETDIRFTKDNRIMVCHDETGERMCNEVGAVKETTFAEVRRWDAGWGFVDGEGHRPYAGQGIQFPTMEELIDRYEDIPLNVDIKEASPKNIGQLIEVIRGCHAEHRVLLTSFSSSQVQAVRKQGYNGPIGFGLRQIVTLFFAPRLLLKLFQLGDRVQIPQQAVGPFQLGSKRFIGKCHKLGLPVDFWVVNEIARAKELVAMGADGIMSDDPELIISAFSTHEVSRRC